MTTKPKRVVDKDLLERVRSQRCVACGKTPCDAHHVSSRGSGGEDTPENLMPLCRTCHRKWHAYGPTKMIRLYPGVHYWLQQMGRTDVLRRAARTGKL